MPDAHAHSRYRQSLHPGQDQRPASRRPLPLLTAACMALLAGLYLLFPGPEWLAYNANAVSDGQVWRLITAHFVHADTAHLAWNGLALAVLGALIERQARALLFGALATGVVFVSALLISPWSSLMQYCGLSGVLNSLLVLALFLEWRRGGGLPVLLVALGSVGKLAWELAHGSSLLTQISWPPYPAAHAAGMAGGVALLIGYGFRRAPFALVRSVTLPPVRRPG